MPKKTSQDNYRVVIDPRRLGDLGFASMSDSSLVQGGEEVVQKRYQERCSEIVDAIKEAKIWEVGTINIECDTHETCSYCGDPWVGVGDTFNGGCCHKDSGED